MFRFGSTYKVKPGDNLGDPAYWNARLQDLDIRLNSVESFTSKINAAVDTVTNAGIDRINNTLQPVIDVAQASVTTLQNDVSSLEATVLTDQNSVTSQLNALLVTAQGLVANMESLGTLDGGTF